MITSAADLFSAGYKADRAKIFYDQLLARIRAVPGVESATLARVRPFSYKNYSNAPIAIDGYQAAPDEQLSADYNEVGENYFATMGIPLISGRDFNRTDDENAPLVAVVNETMAAKYWPGKDPLGQRLQVKDRWMQVVGVAKNSYYRTKLETPKPFFYVPVRQNFSVQNVFLVRTQQSTASMMSILANEIHALDPNLAPLDTITLQEQVDRMSFTQRLAVTLLAVFGGMALFLAAIGLYAVMAYAVSQSTRELGLRMALGAGAGDLLRLVMSRGLILTAGKRHCPGRGGGAHAHAPDGQHALQSESARSVRVRIGLRDHDNRSIGRVLFAGMACDADRPGARIAKLTLYFGIIVRVRACRLS